MTSLPEEMTDLHPQLANDTIELGEFDLCRLLLMNDNNYPWFILVPKVSGVTEIYQLFQTDQEQLMRESSLISRMLVEVFKADKVNIGALGNVVPQLHIHHIARYETDPVWPAPVWGKLEAVAYDDAAIADIKSKVRDFMTVASRVVQLD